MPDPSELLGVARLLLNTSAAAPPSDAQFRRAVSTAYYALFHTVLRAASQRFMGPHQEHTAGFSLLYRGFNHGQMKTVCEALKAPTLSDKLKSQLGRSSVSQDMRSCAATFLVLQDARHRADYDPSAQFRPSNVALLVDSAEVAMAAFDRVAPDEKTDILALMMTGARR